MRSLWLVLLSLVFFTGCLTTVDDDDTAADDDDTTPASDDDDSTEGPVCGDGEVEGDEDCDDQNDEPLDGCDDCVDSVDVCEGEVCEGAPAACDGNVMLPAVKAGVCVVTDSQPVCEYPAAGDPVDCGDVGLGSFCREGSCETGVIDIESHQDWSVGTSDAALLLSDGSVLLYEDGVLTPSAHAEAVAVSQSGTSMCSVGADGDVRCSGDNAQGQLGTGDTTPSATPVVLPLPSAIVPTDVASSLTVNLVLDSNGDVRAFGDPFDDDQILYAGEVVAEDVVGLGQGEQAVSTRHANGDITWFGYPGWGINDAISTFEAVGADQTCTGWDTSGGITGGQVWHLGRDDGLAGSGPSTEPDTGGEIVDVPGLTGAVDLAHGITYYCAVLTDGDLSCWEWQTTPAVVPAPEGVRFVDIEALASSPQGTFLARSDDGRLFTVRGTTITELTLP